MCLYSYSEEHHHTESDEPCIGEEDILENKIPSKN